MEVLQNISLKNYNTFGIDVKAALFAEVGSVEDIKDFMRNEKYNRLPRLILGGGSNILFTKDFEGVVLKFASDKITTINETADYALVKAEAGVEWHDLVVYCVNRNLGGIENLSLIPGCAGAAPIQNIGAYGQELKDTFHSLSGIFSDTLVERTFLKDECRFGYRDSIFKRELKERFIITSISLKLSKHPVINAAYGNISEELQKAGKTEYTIKDVSEAVCRIRRSKLPDPKELGNAGSFFKNPVIETPLFDELRTSYVEIPSYPVSEGFVKVPAGWLIEKAGLKGFRLGSAGVHEKQALVIVNYGTATGKDVLELKEQVKRAVLEKFSILLEEEVNII